MVHTAASHLQKLHKATSTACPQAEAKNKKKMEFWSLCQFTMAAVLYMLASVCLGFFFIKTRQGKEYQILKPPRNINIKKALITNAQII